MNTLKKLFSFIKKVILISIISSSFLLSQETNLFKHSGFEYRYNYAGFPFYIDLGYAYRKNSSYLFAPNIGVSFEYTPYDLSIFGNVGIEYRYKRFFLDLNYKQGITPPFSTFDYKDLEYFGNIKIGYFFANVELSYNINIGQMLNRKNISPFNLATAFKIEQFINVNTRLYESPVHKLSMYGSIGINILPFYNEYSYSLNLRLPYTFFHYWGELGIMPSISYSGYFDKSKMDYSIGSKYLYSLLMIPLGDSQHYTQFYDFLSFIHTEYRLFFRFFPEPFDGIFLVVFANVGYGKYINQRFDNGSLLYVLGGGIGYNLFGVAPMQLTFGVDNHNNLVINYLISPIYQF